MFKSLYCIIPRSLRPHLPSSSLSSSQAPGSSRSLPSFVRKGSRHLGDHDNVGNQNVRRLYLLVREAMTERTRRRAFVSSAFQEAREYCNFPDPSTGVYFNGSPQDDSTSRFPGVRTTLERFDSISGDGNHNAMNSISVSFSFLFASP